MAPPRRQARRRPRRLPGNAAFLNVPYDAKYEQLFLAFLAGLSGFALIPRATLEIPGSQRRLERIIHLLRRCRYSFHDLSRVELDPTPPATPRFNMPFELGLAVAWASTSRGQHEWVVFEGQPHRVKKSLSALGGTAPYIHHATPRGVLSALANALSRRRHRPTVRELEAILADLKGAAVTSKQDLSTESLYAARPFRELVVAAIEGARQRIPSLRPEG